MYSQCPDCLARFRVTAAQLRAAHGTVRCGRCGTAFDALARLSDTPPGGSEPPDSGVTPADKIAAAAASGVPAEYHFSAADLEKVFIEARDWSPPRATTPSFAADSEPEELLVEEPEQVEDITLEGERIAIETVDIGSLAPEELEELGNAETPLDFDLTGDVEVLADEENDEAPDDEAPVVTAQAATADGEPVREWPLPPPSRPRSPPPGRAATTAAQRWMPMSDVDDELLDVDDEAQQRRARVWTVGSVALGALLLLQVAHHYRDGLARQPGVGALVRSTYGALGVPLGNAWNLEAFELRQWGAGSDLAAGRLNVRASLTNRADFAQPLPLLRVEIEDRFGEAVAIRDFKPSEYLKDPGRLDRLLGTGESADAQLDVVAAGLDGVGYRLNVCMSDADGTVRCASAPG
jgi:predicted Zn finger-like uncharacterized protein